MMHECDTNEEFDFRVLYAVGWISNAYNFLVLDFCS